jgi:cysteine desulfurase
MEKIYFDNSATTKMSERAKNKMTRAIDLSWGNPSSLHSAGLDAEKLISEARGIILSSLGIMRPQRWELIFTSSGTESNNLAILGTVRAKARKGNEKIMITSSEHSSVEECVAYLEKEGFTVLRIPTLKGELDLDFIEKNATGVILASIMHINNETGAIYDVKRAFEIIREKSPDCVCHTDCVQSYLKARVTRKSLGADLISISAHKVNGPKGVGALYIAPELLKAKKIAPIIYGGGQENNLRSGTENVYGICAFGEAVKEHLEKLNDEISCMQEVREYIISHLPEGVVAKAPVKCAPHIINITLPKIRSETALHALSARGVFVSSGSACASNSTHKASRALLAFGVSDDEADSSLRISLCPDNTKEQADILLDALREAVAHLARK